ncbi:MAG: 3',5'-cyclic-AMP phosphodiesterase [Elainella sp. Prado103]|nr:3',5'-cyclic-AMP phosphodiesterase [Elainella sp. Prado103]
MTDFSPLRVVQISDTHLFADDQRELLGIATTESLDAVLQSIDQLQPPPDVLLLTGDLSQDETPHSYERLRDMVSALQIPTYWLPGNHDQPWLMVETLGNQLISPTKAFQRGGWNFILLNSMAVGKVYGELVQTELNWLEQQLQRSNQPTLVAIHHPPCEIGSAWMDQIGLHDPQPLLTLFAQYSQVKLVLFGHIHQEFETQQDGMWLLGCPSTCVQFKPRSPDFAIDECGPGFRLLQLYPDGRFESQIQRVNYCKRPNLAATGY